MIGNTISSRLAALVGGAALRAGASQAQLFSALRVGADQLRDDLVRIPTDSAWRAWELIYAAAGPTGGLCAAATATRGSLTVWDYLFTSGPTLSESLRSVVDLRAVIADPLGDGEVVESGGLLSVRDTAAIEPGPILALVEEFTLALMLQRAREATGHPLVPVRVAFRHRAPRNHRHLIEVFGTGRIIFDAPCSELTFLDAGALPTGGDPHLGAIHRGYAELLIASARPAPGSIDRIRAALREAMGRGALDLDSVAATLALSPRTLQRRLGDLGTTWRAEVEAVRYEHAMDLLRDTDLPMDAIAARLGYADPRTLRRAFRRRAGQSPSEFRRRAGSGPISG
ncbi:AraC family transcriptional regulator [Nocardia aurantiaca]|uniref:Helix-turn-helix domain-containing protein n=1 Tax=Nocardia aurantiaca TaxID=2675850 RepID=A0A6I3L4E6_9NOCA|nr:AraC family transcriptional regulator [Nocardia aurantiaca]MTE15346.1 helix-turn-helix domain-containing protein [Nocardia aurantiaca]